MPATETTQSPVTAPAYALHRFVKDAVDTGDITEIRRGMNMASFEEANIQVVPSTNADPTIEVMFWSDEAGMFISENAPITVSGTGAGKSYELSAVKAKRRRLFVYVTGVVGAGETVKVFVNGALAQRS